MVDLIDILKKCDDAYTNSGEYYKFTAEDKIVLEKYGFFFYEESTDSNYDSIYNFAKKIFSTDEYFSTVGSKTKKNKVKLPFVMGSMTEAHKDELQLWIRPNKKYVVSYKYDGCSVGIEYKNGKLIHAYTRGDGYEGQDITKIFQRFENKFPKELKEQKDLLVRGEIIVKKQEVPLMLQELKELTGKTYANGRNTVAGLLNAKEVSPILLKYAHFVAYHIEMNKTYSENDMFNELEKNDFEVAQYFLINGNEINEKDLENRNIYNKAHYEYDIDGLIITIDDKDESDLGYWTGTINPKCSMKYKVGCIDSYAESIIKTIKWQLSSYGYFKPVIEFEPVELDGTIVCNATGNNYQNVIDNHLCIGAKIRLHKSGLIIPFIDETLSYPTEQNYNLPSNCETYINGVDLIYETYTNQDYDSEMALQKLVYFCDKLNIEYAGEGNLKRLMIETELSNMSVHNLILLPITEFQNAIGINGMKLFASLHEKISKSTLTQFLDAVSAFGRGIGELKLNKIMDLYGDLPFDRNKIMNADGWSDITADQYMSNYCYFIDWMKFLNENNIQLKSSIIEQNNNEYQDVIVVFTGVRDKQMEEKIKMGGGKIVSSCTKACNLVIAKDVNENSTKIKKAKENGVKIISYDEALDKFK